ncbi:hypothetical protein AURDEDRAFT_115917 [Auricularia subglabra TFB-10046 SS5]|nr:hypothetical protein AURDEDRAFT_115917 [Auricularia subglabra TFB-10046 SS5]
MPPLKRPVARPPAPVFPIESTRTTEDIIRAIEARSAWEAAVIERMEAEDRAELLRDQQAASAGKKGKSASAAVKK